MDFFLQGVSSQFDLGGNLLNGYLVTYVILGMLIMQIPLLVALVSGDAIAGEAGAGTLRLLLTKPVSRAKIIVAKYAASVVYSVLLLLWLAITTLGISVLIFGTGDLAFGKSDQVIILLRDDIVWRYCCAFGFAALAMAAVSALALFLSVMADNSIGPIVGTMGVVIVFTIITNLDVSFFNVIKPYLFTSHMLGWKGFFSDPVPAAALTKSVAVLLAYIGGLLGLTIYLFNRKDIQT
jgi:ABC-2 type transport system permease protein